MAPADDKLRPDPPESANGTASQRPLLEAFLEGMPDGFAALGTDHRFTFVNSRAEQLWGKRRDEIIGRTPHDLFGESPLSLAFHDALEGTVVECELFQSSQQWLSYQMNPTPEAGLSVYFEDITARKGADIIAARLAAIVDSSDDVIISKTLDGIITSWNRTAERVFGYTAAEAIGQPILLLIPPDRQDEEVAIIERLKRGERVDHFETVRQRKDGSLVDLSLTISPIKDAAGRVIGASKIARDITERRRVEDALRKSEALSRSVLNHSPDCIKLLDLDGRVRF